ncbi:6-phospho-beta-glucosidase [Brachybacterium halotolerans subsp. kimchii]|uniref:family 4 glycosyl hydrolase n=1 Tax=Brachybacterium halotolerans TaxID=2795215 RepID=UPI001E5C0755|nr:6-phospho-beta-glucosidase [Brachybacterium halotolerans]UEJ81182.1 6-phospho-beta-glucosidase [Brachybacterium halotolerans subsp. kimchii]
MKLTILGGGGFRVPLVYEAAATGATGLTIDEIVLQDVEPSRLRTIERVVEELGAELRAQGRTVGTLPRLIATTDLREAVAGADFVFSAVRVGGAEGRTVDERVALDLGLLGQETVGAGGLAYALRTLPVALEIARTIAEVAPRAWTITFTNPAGIVTEAMRSVLGDRVVGICDTPIGLVRRVSRLIGEDVDAPDALDRIGIDYVGLNHLGWLRGLSVDGQDRLPGILADNGALEQIEEARLVGFDWVRAMRALPNEYLYYYLFTQQARERILEAGTTRGEFLVEQQGRFYRQAAEGAGSEACCDGPLATWRATLHERESTYMAESREADEERRPEDVAGGGYQEVALRLMTAIASGRTERMILDVGNAPAGSSEGSPSGSPTTAPSAADPSGRIVPQLPADLVLEVPCLVDGDGVHPQAVGPVPLEQLGLMAQQRGAERCILEAATVGDPVRARRAAWEGFSTHPLVRSVDLGGKLVDAYARRQPAVGRLLGY